MPIPERAYLLLDTYLMVDFWPYSLAPSTWRAVGYLVISGGSTALTYWLCVALGRTLDKIGSSAAARNRLIVGRPKRACGAGNGPRV